MTRKVFFYVQHLWGVGHVYRATRIAHGLRRAGFEVHLVWGGTLLPGFDFDGLHFHHLTPVRTSDASFSELLHADGTTFSDGDKEVRKSLLLELYRSISPDVLITEAFPFGRRQMRFELLPLLEVAASANPRPLIVSSIRDIMQEDRKESRVLESNNLIRNFFNLVLVHGDERLIPIDETLQGVEEFADKVRYTGLVTPDPVRKDGPGEKTVDVLVSVGGGAFGKSLLLAALVAARIAKPEGLGWKITTGTEIPDKEFQQIENSAPSGVEVVRHIPDMVAAMRKCRVSVSHSGYNTVADVLRAGCAAVLYPYTGGRETEQLRRASMMAQHGFAQMVGPDELSAENLLNAIESAKIMQIPDVRPDMEGASKSAEILLSHLD